MQIKHPSGHQWVPGSSHVWFPWGFWSRDGKTVFYQRGGGLTSVHPDGVNMNYDGRHPDRNEAVYYVATAIMMYPGELHYSIAVRGARCMGA